MTQVMSSRTPAHQPRRVRYERGKAKFLNDLDLCEQNRRLYSDFFEQHERRLKRINRLNHLDEACYRTLYFYIVRFRNINRWFKGKALVDLTHGDIQQVYDDLEDGVIRTQKGEPFRTLEDYYAKIFKSTLFKMAGKKDMACEIIQAPRLEDKEVRFIDETAFRRLAEQPRFALHQLLLWLAWDYGENINALLQLWTDDFFPNHDPATGQTEYRLNLRREILKRSRRPRALVNNFPETARLLTKVLSSLGPGQRLFPFGYAEARKKLCRWRKAAGVVCTPNGEPVTFKDLRSSMACDLLSKGWTRDQINARLGHKPSSVEIDCYLNFLAVDQHNMRSRPEHQPHPIAGVQPPLMSSVPPQHQSNIDEVVALREQVALLTRLLYQHMASGATPGGPKSTLESIPPPDPATNRSWIGS